MPEAMGGRQQDVRADEGAAARRQATVDLKIGNARVGWRELVPLVVANDLVRLRVDALLICLE